MLEWMCRVVFDFFKEQGMEVLLEYLSVFRRQAVHTDGRLNGERSLLTGLTKNDEPVRLMSRTDGERLLYERVETRTNRTPVGVSLFS